MNTETPRAEGELQLPRKLQYFEVGKLLTALRDENNHYYKPWNLSNTGTFYLMYCTINKLGYKNLYSTYLPHLYATDNLERKDIALFVEEPWVDDVFERVEEIRLNALKQAP